MPLTRHGFFPSRRSATSPSRAQSRAVRVIIAPCQTFAVISTTATFSASQSAPRSQLCIPTDRRRLHTEPGSVRTVVLLLPSLETPYGISRTVFRKTLRRPRSYAVTRAGRSCRSGNRASTCQCSTTTALHTCPTSRQVSSYLAAQEDGTVTRGSRMSAVRKFSVPNKPPCP